MFSLTSKNSSLNVSKTLLIILHIVVLSFIIVYVLSLLRTITLLQMRVENQEQTQKNKLIQLRNELNRANKMKNALQFFNGMPLVERPLPLEYIPDSLVNTSAPPEQTLESNDQEQKDQTLFTTTYKNIAVEIKRKNFSEYTLQSLNQDTGKEIVTKTITFPESVTCSSSVKWGKSTYQYVPEQQIIMVEIPCSTTIKTYVLRENVSHTDSYGMGGISGLIQINFVK